MTREQDWRIHEYMGNDLTGWEWADGCQEVAASPTHMEHKLQRIPHYSTTWEGFGLISDWLTKHRKQFVMRKLDWNEFCIEIDNSDNVYWSDSAPQSLAKAYIAAMEERDNG